MEEKERYEYFFGTNTVKDNKTNQFYGCVVDLLNQQDKRIKELEEENQQLKQQLADTEEMRLENLNDGCRCVERDSKIIVKLQQENQQLKEKLHSFESCMKKYNVKDAEHLDLMLFVLSGETKYRLKEIKDKYKKELEQSQKELAISELKKFKDFIDHNIEIENDVGALKLQEFYDNQVEELKGEK